MLKTRREEGREGKTDILVTKMYKLFLLVRNSVCRTGDQESG